MKASQHLIRRYYLISGTINSSQNATPKRHIFHSHLQQRPGHSKPILKNVVDMPLASEALEISCIICTFIRKLYIKFHTLRYKNKRHIVIASL